MIKFTIPLRRKPSMTYDEFVAYHRERHAPLFCALPAVRRRVVRAVHRNRAHRLTLAAL